MQWGGGSVIKNFKGLDCSKYTLVAMCLVQTTLMQAAECCRISYFVVSEVCAGLGELS